MTGFWIRFLITACGLLVASRLLDGMHFGGAASLLFAALVLALVLALALELYPFGKAAIDNQVRAGDQARRGASEKDNRVGNFLWRTHTSGRRCSNHAVKDLGRSALDGVPIASIKKGWPGRNSVYPNAIRGQ